MAAKGGPPAPMKTDHRPEPERIQALRQWLAAQPAALGLRPETLSESDTPDVLRLQRADGGRVLALTEAPANLAEIATRMAGCGLQLPRLLAVAPDQGFALLDEPDLPGYVQALREAGPAEADALMRDAIAALLRWQCQGEAAGPLPACDEAGIRAGLQDFADWAVAREFGQTWSDTQQGWWAHCCRALVRSALAQPQGPLHGDYGPQQLRVLAPREAGNPLVLGFQRAQRGPLTEDIAALLRDAALAWDEERELDWAIRYWEQARKLGLLDGHVFDTDFGEFWRALEWSGLQRHLTLIGAACRRKHQAGRSDAVEALPRLLAYCIKVSTRYVELAPLTRLLEGLRSDLVQTGFNLR